MTDEKKRLGNLEKIFEDANIFVKEPNTVKECKKIKELLQDSRLDIPNFDKPKYGTLYKAKDDWEYVLGSENDIHEAITEMEKAGIKNVKFVEQ